MGSHSNPVPKDMAANLQISFVSVMEEPSQQNNQGESANHTYLRNRMKCLKDALVATVTISEAHNLWGTHPYPGTEWACNEMPQASQISGHLLDQIPSGNAGQTSATE